MLTLLRVLGRVPTGSAFAALPLAAALTAATQQWCWVVWACSILLALTLAWMFAPWIPYVRDLVPAHRRFQKLEEFWVEGHDLAWESVTDDALEVWFQRRADWSQRVTVWLRGHVSAVEANRFRRITVSDAEHRRARNPEHGTQIAAIKVQLDELIRLRDAEAERLR